MYVKSRPLFSKQSLIYDGSIVPNYPKLGGDSRLKSQTRNNFVLAEKCKKDRMRRPTPPPHSVVDSCYSGAKLEFEAWPNSDIKIKIR